MTVKDFWWHSQPWWYSVSKFPTTCQIFQQLFDAKNRTSEALWNGNVQQCRGTGARYFGKREYQDHQQAGLLHAARQHFRRKMSCAGLPKVCCRPMFGLVGTKRWPRGLQVWFRGPLKPGAPKICIRPPPTFEEILDPPLIVFQPYQASANAECIRIHS